MTPVAVAYSLPDAAKAAGVSVDTLRKAIHATDPAAFPPPLRAKRKGTSEHAPYYITPSELARWVDSWPDA